MTELKQEEEQGEKKGKKAKCLQETSPDMARDAHLLLGMIDKEFKSINDIYFGNLRQTREMYKDFDLKLRILYVMMKEPYGMSVKQMIRRLGGKQNGYVREGVADALTFWNEAGIVDIIYDGKQGTSPSPQMWECDVRKALEVFRRFKTMYTILRK